MLNDYFQFDSPDCHAKYLAIPNKNNPRILVSLQNYKYFNTGLSIHNTASAKNKIIKKIISASFPLFIYSSKNVISLKEKLLELITILQIKLSAVQPYYSSFYIGTSDNANRKITAQICNDEGDIFGILKIPIAEKSEKYISNEFEILNSLKQYNLKSCIFPESSFLVKNSPQIIVFQKDIFKESKPIKNSICDLVNEASCELAFKTITKNSTEYFKKLFAQMDNLELESNLQKFIKRSTEKILEAEVPTVLIHGDFVKYNMKEKHGRLALIDWEFARTGLPLFDLFHFVFQGKLQINKVPITTAIKKVFSKPNIKWYQAYLSKINLRNNLVKSLFTIYLLDNLHFESNLKPNMQLIDSNFYKALQIIQYEKN